MDRKGIEYRQHTIQWAVTHIPGDATFKARASVCWTDVSGVFHLHPLSEICGRFNSAAAAERQLIEEARHWIDKRLTW
jgi:hypothetical protein